MTFRLRNLMVGMAVFLARPVLAAEPPTETVINAMEESNLAVPEKAKVEVVEGHTGQALKLSFTDDNRGVFVQSRTAATPDWDQAAGFSFWVKGDGSNHLGGLEVIWNGDYGIRYGYAFPINDTGWKKIVVPWHDLIPELSAPLKPIDLINGNAPSKLGPIAFGKWWYWGDFAAHSYTVDDIRLEPAIPLDIKDWRPTGVPLARTLNKLKAGQPITIVTMGDSLTDVHHWTNRDTSWPAKLQAQLKAKYGSEVKLVNPAMGGTELRHNMVVMPRWTTQEPRPDLVTVFFGFNDYNGGMRGDAFTEAQKDVIDRIRRATGGTADVLIMTTVPPLENCGKMAEMADACRKAAKEKNAGLADGYSAFAAVTGADREHLNAWDKVHLGEPGQELVAKTVMQAIENGGNSR